MRAFLLLFLLFPVLELFVFFQVSVAIGFFPALALIIAGSALGVLVVRVAGLATALNARQSLQRGELPAEQVFQGLMMAVGGGLLLLPGFISDVLGLLCLLPFTRKLIGNKLQAKARAQASRQRSFAEDLQQGGRTYEGHARAAANHAVGREPNVIEGEFEKRD
ncbi:phage T7 F exclusion suppressor FxsA [Pseudomonas sp. M47T1]|uniref:FxsA family protein n=1 Tax=unclassified Pseudomonas TaxID=196821 RepID=UPI00026077FB|nr:FxsA family protein [Pseudomonas sp. M47T1]EIK98064.1 phage T7 F exclusion suppressor FxsA [Pseudomonas sp. M47T1]